MANRFLNNITINDEYTLPNADGTADQIITTDGSGQLSFVDQNTINAGNAEHVVIYAKNTHTASIAKGTPVYITGTVGATDTVEIAPADAGNSAKMPAVGLLDATLAVNAFGYVITGGFMDNITTDPIDGATPTSNDTVYVKVGGGLTLTKPTGPTGLIQNVAKVGKVSGGNSGSLIVSSILRTNDVPNLTTGKIWVGDGNTVESTVVHLDETNGRMGIGTTSPSEKLEVDGNIKASGGIYVSGTNSFLWNNDAGSNLRFGAGGSEKMRITSSGNVGIGTTSPGARLDVAGDSNSDFAPLTSVSLVGKTASGTGWTGTSVLTGYTHSAGNTDSLVTNIVPTANTNYLVTFTISGITAGRYERIFFGGVQHNIYVSQDLTRTISFRTENTDPMEVVVQSGATGAISIDSVKSVGARSSVITTSDSSGNARNQVRNGHNQTSLYIGYQAGESVTSEINVVNIGIGDQTLRNNLSGTVNTSIGYQNLKNSFGASYMTTLGYNLFPNYSAQGNMYSIAIGTNIATSSDMTGGSNILLGNNMFMNATTANGNVAMGYNAMRNVTSGSKNVAIGPAALFDNTNGTGNMVLGEYSLANMTTGNYNISIGNNAGRYLGGTTTANTNSSNSIFLGYRSGPNANSQNNQIVIGHDAVGAGSNTVTIGATTIAKTILNGNVGIGTTSPSVKLEVAQSEDHKGLKIVGFDDENNSNIHLYVDNFGQDRITSSEFLNITSGGSSSYTATGYLRLRGVGTSSQIELNGSDIKFTTTSAERMRLTNTGLGIGTTSPSAKLHVAGGIKLSDNQFLTWDTSNTRIVGQSGYMQLQVAGTDTMRLTSSGNVGIGTNSPQSILHIADANPEFILEDTTNPNKCRIRNIDGALRYEADYDSEFANSKHQFFVDGTEKLRILSNGDVGIGTTSPTTALHINANAPTIRLQDATSGDNHYFTGNNGELRVQTSGYMTMRPGNTVSTTFLANGNVGIGTTSPSEKLDVAGAASFAAASDGTNGLTFSRLSANNWKLDTSGVGEVYRISGNAVYYKQNLIVERGGLAVSPTLGSITPSTQTFKVRNQADTLDIFSVTDGGNVGIGTTSPAAAVDIVRTSLPTTGTDYGVLVDMEKASSTTSYDTDLYGLRSYVRATSTGSNQITNLNGLWSKAEHTGTGNTYFILGSANRGYHNGSGNTGAMYGAFNETRVTGAGTSSHNYVIGTSTIADLQAANASVNYLQSAHVTTKMSAGTVDNNLMAMILDLDVTGGTVSGDLEYLRIQNDTIGATVNGTSRAINSESTLPSRFAGDMHFESNVGIGTTSPNFKLDVNGDIRIEEKHWLLFGGVGAQDANWIMQNTQAGDLSISEGMSGTRFFIENGGNVGIGTTSPATKLHVLGESIRTGVDALNYVDISSTSTSTSFSTVGNGFIAPDIIFNINTTNRLTIDGTTGNVGIGTATPSEKLEVDGNVQAETLIATDLTDGYVPWSRNGTVGLQDSEIYQDNGQVGIGTTTLSQALNVDGDILADGYRVTGMQTAPSSKGDTGTLGEIRITADYIYVCYATNSWRRVALSAW